MTLLLIHSKCNSFYLLIQKFQSTTLPPISSLATTSLFSMSVGLRNPHFYSMVPRWVPDLGLANQNIPYLLPHAWNILAEWLGKRYYKDLGLIKLIYRFTIMFVFISELQVQHMEVPRLGVKLELQLPAHTTATATLDLNCICHYATACENAGSLTHWARQGTEPSSSWVLFWVLNLLSYKGNSPSCVFW